MLPVIVLCRYSWYSWYSWYRFVPPHHQTDLEESLLFLNFRNADTVTNLTCSNWSTYSYYYGKSQVFTPGYSGYYYYYWYGRLGVLSCCKSRGVANLVWPWLQVPLWGID